jgi:serine/threonine-protein kinase
MESESSILNERYKLIQQAGVGGMSTVYKGQDLILGRNVAIKMLHESLTGDAEFLRRFQQEAHAAANLSHPNIVTVHDIGQDGRRYYIVMEYVTGDTLKELIRQQQELYDQPISIDRSVDLVIQVCAGVGYAHRANLVHCDVKSQNALVTREDQVKVTDFGIARALSEASLHRSDLVWGTPQYFSPEQASGNPATPASDVYSIGVILFELLTGRLPFEAESHTALAVKHIQDTPPRVTEYNPVVPPRLSQIVDKVLSKEPTGRYRTADQFGRVLKSYRESSVEATGAVVMVNQGLAINELPTAYYEPSPIPEKPALIESSVPVSFDFHIPVPSDEIEETDWMAVILGVLALLSLLGLIPLWYLVYLRYTG